jgi:hypothetical protein
MAGNGDLRPARGEVTCDVSNNRLLAKCVREPAACTRERVSSVREALSSIF